MASFTLPTSFVRGKNFHQIVSAPNGSVYIIGDDPDTNDTKIFKGNANDPTSFTQQTSSSLTRGAIKLVSSTQFALIGYNVAGMTANLEIQYYTISTDTLGTASVIAAIDSDTTYAFQEVRLDVDNNGDIHVFFRTYDAAMGNSFETVNYVNNVGGSWNSVVVVAGAPTTSRCYPEFFQVSPSTNIPILAYSRLGGGDRLGVGNAVNATSFTFTDESINSLWSASNNFQNAIAVDPNSNIYVGYGNDWWFWDDSTDISNDANWSRQQGMYDVAQRANSNGIFRNGNLILALSYKKQWGAPNYWAYLSYFSKRTGIWSEIGRAQLTDEFIPFADIPEIQRPLGGNQIYFDGSQTTESSGIYDAFPVVFNDGTDDRFESYDLKLYELVWEQDHGLVYNTDQPALNWRGYHLNSGDNAWTVNFISSTLKLELDETNHDSQYKIFGTEDTATTTHRAVGQLIGTQASVYTISCIALYMRKVGSPVGTMRVTVDYQTSQSNSTGEWESVCINAADIPTTWGWVYFPFDNHEQVAIPTVSTPFIVAEFWGGDAEGTTNYLEVGADSTGGYTPGTAYDYASDGGRWDAISGVDLLFKIFELGTSQLSRNSATHSGFENITTPADTHPFNTDDNIRFTVQAADALSNGFYLVEIYDSAWTAGWRDATLIEINAPTGDVLVVQDASHGHTAETPTLVQNYELSFYSKTLIDSETSFDNTTVYSFSPGLSTQRLAQSFTGDGNIIHGVMFKMTRIGDPGTITVELKAHSGTFGSNTSEPTGPALATMSFDASEKLIINTLYEVDLFFDTPFTSVNGTNYFIELSCTGDATNYGRVNKSIGNVHPGILQQFDGVDWTSTFSFDAYFEVFTSTPLTNGQNNHGHTAPNLVLEQASTLAVQEASHTHTADNTVLVQNFTLTVQDASHSHTAENVVLTQASTLTVQETSHTHTAENVALTQANTLAIQEASHTHTADNVVLETVITLTVQDASHTHTADNVLLTQANTLVVQESSHNHTTENVALTQASNLTVQEASHTHTADNVTLTQANTLAVQEASHNHTVDNVSLIQANTLVVQETSHNHTADNAVLTQANTLAVNDSNHTHTADQPALTQANTLTVQEASHTHTADNLTLELTITLVVQDASHTHTAENVALTQANTLTVADSSHTHTADNVTLIPAYTLVVQEASHSHTAENVTLTQANTLVVQEASHTHTAENVDLVQNFTLTVQETSHTHTADSPNLIQANTLSVQEASHAHTAENVALTQANTLTVQEASHNHTADNVDLTTAVTLVVQDASHTHTADNADLVQANTLVVQEASHNHTAENVSLSQAYNLVVQDASHGHSAENIVLSQNNTLVVEESSHGHTADSTNLIQANILDVQEANHNHTTENVVLSQGNTLIVQDSSHNHLADNVVLIQNNVLVVQESSHNHTADSPVLIIDAITLIVEDAIHGHTTDAVILDFQEIVPGEIISLNSPILDELYMWSLVTAEIPLHSYVDEEPPLNRFTK